MTSHLHALCFDAHDPLRLARFWADFLCWETSEDSSGGITLLPSDDTGFRLRFLLTQEWKAGQNHMHFDLTSTSLDDQKQVVERALELGARHIDIGQRPRRGMRCSPTQRVTWGGPPLMPKAGKERLHFDLAPPAGSDQQAEVDRLVSLGATRIDIGQGDVDWVVMADPDGHEFCVLTPR